MQLICLLLITTFFTTNYPQHEVNTRSAILASRYNELVRSLIELSEAYYYLGDMEKAADLLTKNISVVAAELPKAAKIRLELQRAKTLYYKASLAGSGYDESIALISQAHKEAAATDDRLL